MENETPWSGILLSTVGIAFLAFAIFAFLSDRDLDQNGLRAEGSVIALEARDDSDAEARYAPVITWTDESQEQHQFTASVASSPPQFTPGDRVTVIYDPKSPSAAKIDTPTQRYLLPFLFGGMGFVFAFLGMGAALPFLHRKLTGSSHGVS